MISAYTVGLRAISLRERNTGHDELAGVIDGAAYKIDCLTAENERLKMWIYEALNSLGDPQDACDHDDSKEAALLATIDEAIGKLRTCLNQQQPPQAWIEAKKEIDDGWPDR